MLDSNRRRLRQTGAEPLCQIAPVVELRWLQEPSDRNVSNEGTSRCWWRSKVQPSRRQTAWWSLSKRLHRKKRNILKNLAGGEPSDICEAIKMSLLELDERVDNKRTRAEKFNSGYQTLLRRSAANSHLIQLSSTGTHLNHLHVPGIICCFLLWFTDTAGLLVERPFLWC